ncbi:MAG: hypothetical protein ABR561_07010 [Guyparkeria sp.]
MMFGLLGATIVTLTFPPALTASVLGNAQRRRTNWSGTQCRAQQKAP